MSEPKKLTRSRNKMLGGVCAGIADYTGTDVNIIRLITVILAVVGFGSVVIVYVVAWFLLPEAPDPSLGSWQPPPSP